MSPSCPPPRSRRLAFTLIELLVVVAIITLLISILLPALHGARTQARSAVCLSNLRQISHGWHAYADENNDISVPGRYARLAGVPDDDPANTFDVGNGRKYRARWIAIMGKYVGLFAFNQPDASPAADRQDYDGRVYQCPLVPEWMDARNHAYGYNFQFLGNARTRNGRFINYPVSRARITNFATTVMAADSLGTAAGRARDERRPYSNDGTDFAEAGNHAWTLDPPRLTVNSDRGSGDPGTPRSGPDGRHAGRVNVVFCDGHGEALTLFNLGYRMLPSGALVDTETVDEPPHNRFFSGTGRDDDPPALP